MITELLRKWFGLTSPTCETCEVLRDQLDKSEMERRELLHKLLEREKPEPPSSVSSIEEMQPIKPQFVPWRVRQQMMEAEDRKRADLLKTRAREISELEKDLGVASNTEG